jgi:hypothetical protein
MEWFFLCLTACPVRCYPIILNAAQHGIVNRALFILED